jgi:hypothetical protein
MTREEFLKNKEAAEKYSKRFSMLWLPIFFAILIGNLFLVKKIPEEYSWVFLVVFFAFLFGNLAFTLWIEKRNIERNNLKCPSCKKALVQSAGQIAIATGNCAHCGSNIF